MAAMLAPMRFLQERSFASGDALPVTLSNQGTHRRESTMEAVALPSPATPAESLRPRIAPPPEDELDDDDEELDETLSERLWGLTEMFPDSLRTVAGATCEFSIAAAKKMYSFSRAALWVGTTSFMILVLPVVFETEKLQMEQHQQLQQRQILLGPTAGMSGSMTGSLPPMPGKI